MSPYVERIVERFREAEEDLARQVDEQQERLHYRVHADVCGSTKRLDMRIDV